MTRDSAIYNLKVVIQETGIKPDTLRAWERRYGLPEPARTEGRHRLYSQRDIDTVLWLMARQDEGLSISRAVDLWRTLEAEGKDPLLVHALEEIPSIQPVTAPMEGDMVTALREAWKDACLAFDELQAESVITQALSQFTVETVVYNVLQQGLSEIGEGWYEGAVTVQQEHFASSLAERRVETLIAASPPPIRRERLVVASPPGEDHVFPSLLITLGLKRRGFEVVLLGANVPLQHLKETVEAIEPDLVILSAQQLTTAAALLPAALILEDMGIMLGYGGLVFNRIPEVRSRIPGYFLGSSLEGVTEQVEQILQAAPPQPEVIRINGTYRATLRAYRECLASIESQVWQAFAAQPDFHGYIRIANENLANNIIAGLVFGDMALLGADIDWIGGLLTNHEMDSSALGRYLQAYNEAVLSVLGEEGRVIADWLAGIGG